MASTPPIRFGALCWNQYTDWHSLHEAGRLADRAGYDSIWTWDHLYPIVGSDRGPIFEGWLTLAAWAATTTRARIGLMVGANTFREPTLTAKMVTTLDHISSGRAVLGIGAAWFATEHRAYGLEYGEGPPERLRWLGEALPVIRGMLRGEVVSAAGPCSGSAPPGSRPSTAPTGSSTARGRPSVCAGSKPRESSNGRATRSRHHVSSTP